jgi:hypothetical protein
LIQITPDISSNNYRRHLGSIIPCFVFFAYKPQSPANAPWDYADSVANPGEAPGYSEYTDYSTAPNESPQSIRH